MNQNQLQIVRLSDKAKIPTQEPGSVGYDVYAFGTHTLNAGETRVIPLGFNMALPDGYAAFMWDRSSFGLKGIHIFRQLISNENFEENYQIVVFGGVIDWAYRGQYGVILHNFSGKTMLIPHETRIAQFIIQKCENFPIVEVKMEDFVKIPSVRGERGLGSSDAQNTGESAQKIISGGSTWEK